MQSFTAERWHGDRGALVAIFKRYVTEPSWFKYDEDMETSSVQPNLLAPLGDLWRKLKKEQANLSFPQSELEAVFKSLIDDTWKLTAAEILDWKKTMGKRVRCACRHIQQAASKKTCPRWVQNLIEPDTVNAPGLAAASASATTPDTYKWDAELKRYYRFLPGELPDFGTTFTNDCDDRLYARFQDDTVKELRGSVGGDLGKENSKGQKNGKNQGKSLSSNSVCPTSKKTRPSGSLHHVTQLDGGVKLYVRDRPDRGLLISIYENDVRQTCQVSADKFDDKKLAVEFMVDLAESVGKGEVNIGSCTRSEIDRAWNPLEVKKTEGSEKRHLWSQLEC